MGQQLKDQPGARKSCFSCLPDPSWTLPLPPASLRTGWAGVGSSGEAFLGKLWAQVNGGWGAGCPRVWDLAVSSYTTHWRWPLGPTLPRPRSIPASPASLPGRAAGLAEEPDGCGGGREASLAPQPGLNIYYVLFGLWGRGREGCCIDLELPRSPAALGRGRYPPRPRGAPPS